MNKFVLLFLGCTTLLLSGCSDKKAKASADEELIIHENFLQFDSTRTSLSLLYLKDHYGIVKDKPVIDPKMIVVHWTVIPTFEETFDFFNPSTLNASRGDIQSAGALNVSSQYLIKRNGEITQLLPDTLMARHVIGLNYMAIGIENIGSDNRPLTSEQLAANIRLIRHLTKKYNIEYLIGHYEYIFFEHSRVWKEINTGYRTEKTDPGIGFMVSLRDQLKDLNLKGIPENAFQRYLK